MTAVTDGPLVLVVDDEAPIRRFLRALLQADGYRVVEADTGAAALEAAARVLPAVVILDLGLPDIDGLDVVRRLREWSSTPIVVLSARGREADKVAALDLGADDYLTKPFGAEELRARLRVALRWVARAESDAGEPIVRSGDVTIDLAARRVRLAGRDVHLTPTEWNVLSTLARHGGKVVTHRQLLRDAWGEDYVGETHYVRLYMAQLRRKLEADPARPAHLLTEAGVGYRLVVD
ncbi:MAG: response regulator [Ardenticatenales bacterium]|jgi:two-component system KDP operon response regulator KdpE|nr:response regulator [Ardenticatenales bacterium]